jgi:hypothetical protein
MFLPIGFYGRIPVYFSHSQLTVSARRIHGSFLTVRVDYALGRETIFRDSLGCGDNVCIMPFLLLFGESCLLDMCWPPYTSLL